MPVRRVDSSSLEISELTRMIYILQTFQEEEAALKKAREALLKGKKK